MLLGCRSCSGHQKMAEGAMETNTHSAAEAGAARTGIAGAAQSDGGHEVGWRRRWDEAQEM